MPEPTLSEVHADLVGRLKHDERLRHVEQEQASQSATMSAMRDEMRAMRAELLHAIEVNKPRSPWPAVGSLAGVMGVIVVLMAAIYRQV